jgi:hypothetical protein
MTLLWVVLWAVLVHGGLAASRFHERNHTGLLFLYDFTEGQVPTSPPSEVRDVSGRYLMGNLTASTTGAVAWSASRQGMSIPNIGGGARATSQLTTAALLPLLTDEFSIEFFLSSPVNPLSQNLLIAGFGDWGAGTPFPVCDATNTATEGGWRMSADQGSLIDVDVVMSVGGTPTCVSVSIGISTNTLVHIVVRARAGELSIFSHGSDTIVSTPNPTLSPTLWTRRYTPLVLSSPHVTNGWTGSLYMLAMYDRFLADDEIEENRSLGPPNSVPWASATALAASEDTPALLN